MKKIKHKQVDEKTENNLKACHLISDREKKHKKKQNQPSPHTFLQKKKIF